jgi:hypothetical protein
MPRSFAKRARSSASIERIALSGELCTWKSIAPFKSKSDCPCAGATSRNRQIPAHVIGLIRMRDNVKFISFSDLICLAYLQEFGIA